VGCLLFLLFDFDQLVRHCSDLLQQLGFAFFPLAELIFLLARDVGEALGGKACAAVAKLAFHRVSLAFQLPPSGVDDHFGVVKRAGFILSKEINHKVFHHISKEVLLTPSAEKPGRHARGFQPVGGGNQADLMAVFGKLAYLFHPEGRLAAADQRSALGHFLAELDHLKSMVKDVASDAPDPDTELSLPGNDFGRYQELVTKIETLADTTQRALDHAIKE